VSRRPRAAFTLIELLIVIAIIAVLIALLIPAVQKVRESAARTQCQNNLRQVGIALHSFHAAFTVFPASGWTTVGPGNPAGKAVGWRPLILPYLEQENLQRLFDFSKNWWEEPNATSAATPVAIFQCPSVPPRTAMTSAIAKSPRPAMTFTSPLAPTDYEAIMGVQPASVDPQRYNANNRFCVMYRNSRVKLREVLDGTSTTIAVLECAGRPTVYRLGVPDPTLSNDQGIGWADSEGPFSFDGAGADGTQEGCTPAKGCNVPMNKKNDNEPYSFHRGGINVVFADGHVQFVMETVPYLTFAALCTRNGSEVVERFEP
jgi:prepilin-type N-terminal cleavage/methylation domain-containing protein/prepilin-type processing-associated H-X9-DG protein